MKQSPILSVCASIALGIQALFFVGCASGFTRSPAQGGTAIKISSDKPVAQVAIDLTPQVREKLKDSLKFDKDALLKSIELGRVCKISF